MITLCTVVLKSCERYLPYLIESIVNKTKLISEVLIAQPDSENISEFYEKRNIKFHRFSHKEDLAESHALCLHECISMASNDYVMLCDPDVFFYSSADEVYLNLFEKHDLGIIGVSHHNSINQAQGFFPYVFNMFLKKTMLPNNDWMKGLIRKPPVLLLGQKDRYETAMVLDGKWLLPGAIPGHIERLPNHGENAIFDVGCNLYLWAEDQSWKWISFQTTNCYTYTTRYFRSNFKYKEKLPFANLIYHRVGGTNQRDDDFEEFKEIYNNSKQEEEE